MYSQQHNSINKIYSQLKYEYKLTIEKSNGMVYKIFKGAYTFEFSGPWLYVFYSWNCHSVTLPSEAQSNLL